jgi:hypothetical protein
MIRGCGGSSSTSGPSTIVLIVHWIDNSADELAALKDGFRLVGIIPSAVVVKNCS